MEYRLCIHIALHIHASLHTSPLYTLPRSLSCVFGLVGEVGCVTISCVEVLAGDEYHDLLDPLQQGGAVKQLLLKQEKERLRLVARRQQLLQRGGSSRSMVLTGPMSVLRCVSNGLHSATMLGRKATPPTQQQQQVQQQQQAPMQQQQQGQGSRLLQRGPSFAQQAQGQLRGGSSLSLQSQASVRVREGAPGAGADGVAPLGAHRTPSKVLQVRGGKGCQQGLVRHATRVRQLPWRDRVRNPRRSCLKPEPGPASFQPEPSVTVQVQALRSATANSPEEALSVIHAALARRLSLTTAQRPHCHLGHVAVRITWTPPGPWPGRVSHSSHASGFTADRSARCTRSRSLAHSQRLGSCSSLSSSMCSSAVTAAALNHSCSLTLLDCCGQMAAVQLPSERATIGAKRALLSLGKSLAHAHRGEAAMALRESQLTRWAEGMTEFGGVGGPETVQTVAVT